MSTLVALALATPLFGFSLTPPSPSALALPLVAQVDAARPTDSSSSGGAAGAPDRGPDASVARRESSSAPAAPMEAPAAATDFRRVGEELRQRQAMGAIHRGFGIATWASMLVTVGLGFIQYYNQYGLFGSLEDTPCVRGDAIFGQEQCWGAPWPHRIAAITTTALYATTFALSFVMPDPLGADQGEAGADLALHKALRWVHLGGMIAQMLFGFAVGQNWFGLERANDFGAMQALATVHQLIGLGTFGALTAAAAVMIF